MNILFLTVSAGEGHNRVSNTVSEYIENNYSSHRTKIIDTFNYVNPNLHRLIIETYLKSIKYVPEIYSFIYKKTELPHSPILDISELFNKFILSKKLFKLIDNFSADIIICTHPFPAEAMSIMKKKNKINIPLISILTDYAIHPSWINNEIDYYILPSDKFVYELDYWKIPKEKAKFFGIPIDSIFSLKKDPNLLKQKFNLDNKFTILLMGGGLGLGKIGETLEHIFNYNLDVQVLVVTGKNYELKSYLDRLHKPNLRVYGYVNNIDELMSVSDIIITKPGGITTTEAINKELPLIIPWHLPGQEKRNTDFILNNGLGMVATTQNALISCINMLKNDSQQYNYFKQNMQRMKKPNAVSNTAEFVLNLTNNMRSII